MANYVNLMDVVYPVGSIYQTMSSTSPSSVIGGTWTQIKTFLMGSASSGVTGGEATHTLTVDEMPSHRHGYAHGFHNFTKDYSACAGNYPIRLAEDYAHNWPCNDFFNNVGGASTQQLAAIYHLLYLVSHCVNRQEVM